MKKYFENVLKAIQPLSQNSQEYVIKQLKAINGEYSYVKNKLDVYIKKQIGIAPEMLNDSMVKAVKVLELYGFNQYSFDGLSSDFLAWFLTNTQEIPTYNPKLMNHHLLIAFQQAYFIEHAANNGEPTYKQVRTTLLTFDDLIKKYEEESKLKFEDLINKIHGAI